MDLMQPTLMSRIIDTGVVQRDAAYVWKAGLQMATLALAGFLGGACCSVSASIAAISMSGRMRQSLFGKIGSLSFAEIDGFKTSSLVTRLTNDVMQMQSMLMMMLRIMVRSPFTLIGSVVMSFFLSPQLALVFCIILPIVFGSIVLVLRNSFPVFLQVQKSLDRVNTIMRENLLGMRVVKAFTNERHQKQRFTQANDDLADNSIRAQTFTILLVPAVNLVMNLSVVAILWFGGNLVAEKAIEIGKIMAFINYLVQSTHSMLLMVNLVVNLSKAQASAQRINEIFSIVPSIQEPQEPYSIHSYDIGFEDVSFSYSNGGALVLQNLSFSIKEGEMVGIIGATGSGKSSLANLIPRLYDVTSGRIRIGGVDIRQMDITDLRRDIGVVMQESQLFSGSIESNLRFGNNGALATEMDDACRDAQILDYIETLPQRYTTPVEQRGQNFSGGQKQRLSLARTLLRNPRILILDDSTSAVDLKTEANLRSSLAKRLQGRTRIVIAQRISAVIHADKIIVLDFGRMVAIGTHKELLQSSEIYRSIAVSQLGEEALPRG